MSSLSRNGLIEPDEARGDDRHEDDRDLDLVRPEEGDDAPERPTAALLGHRFEVARPDRPPKIAAAPAATAAAACDRRRRWRRGCRRAGRRTHQAVAVAASVMPWASSQRSASIAALQPSAAAVTAWR